MAESVNSVWGWFSTRWFRPGMISEYDWENPFFLWFILLIPLIFIVRLLMGLRNSQKIPVAFTKDDIRGGFSSWLRFIPGLFMLLTLVLLIVSVARPQTTNEKVERWTEGIDIILTIDISESMQIQDFKPNRLEAAKEVARDFIQGRYQDRIGIVVFSGDAYSLSPLTTDYDLLEDYIDEINFDLIENRGTAIGSALAVSTNRMREAETKSKVVILLSDGDNTSGNIDPITAAKLAHAYDIKIYTIAVGKEGSVPFGKDFFGRTRYVDNTLDESTLREIANIGEGEFYRVSDNEALQQVFGLIDQYEKAEIKETRFKDTTDFYPVYLKWAIAMFLLWLATKSTFLTNVLQD